MKKIIAALLVLVMMFTFAACSQNGEEMIEVNVRISSYTFDINGPAWVSPAYATAGEAVQNFCNEQKLAFFANNGLYDGFGGEYSTLTEGWLLYINDKISDVGADTAKIKNGDVVEFRYVNYEVTFNEAGIKGYENLNGY